MRKFFEVHNDDAHYIINIDEIQSVEKHEDYGVINFIHNEESLFVSRLKEVNVLRAILLGVTNER